MASVDKMLLDYYKEFEPSSAFTDGFNECAGKLFLPTEENKRQALKRINQIRKKTKDEKVLYFLRAEEFLLKEKAVEEPHHAPSSVNGVFFAHIIKEGFNEIHLSSLVDYSIELLDLYLKKFSKRRIPFEVKVMVNAECIGLVELLEMIKENVETEILKLKINRLIEKAKDYRKAFEVKGLKKGDFSEVYPLLKKYGGKLSRKKVYPKLLKIVQGYPETAPQIEKKALKWFHDELPYFKEVTKELAKVYKCKPTAEKVEEEIKKRGKIKPKNLLEINKEVRKVLQPIAEKELVKINKKYDTRLIETPDYLTVFLPTAAMNSFDSFTKKPFNIFFVTTDTRGSPVSDISDLINTLSHEEYGHCVNFSNVATEFVKKLSFVEKHGGSFDLPITEGISFNREYEVLLYLRKLFAKKKKTNQEQKLINLIEKYSNLDTFLLVEEFMIYKWRIIRFLRAIGDVRINTNKQSLYDFVEWASKETGMKPKTIYNQIFLFQEMPGYAPSYSIFGMKLKAMQEKLRKRGESVVEFNTYAASIGFPYLKIYEKELRKRFKV